MIKTIHGYDELVRQWVSVELQMPIAVNADGSPKQFRTIGVFDDEKGDKGELIAGIVYHDFKGHMVECSLASNDRRWCQKGIITEMMSYPFKVLNVKRFHATCNKKNKKMRKLFEGLGFKLEGCARLAFDGINDAMLYSILENENRWLQNE